MSLMKLLGTSLNVLAGPVGRRQEFLFKIFRGIIGCGAPKSILNMFNTDQTIFFGVVNIILNENSKSNGEVDQL